MNNVDGVLYKNGSYVLETDSRYVRYDNSSTGLASTNQQQVVAELLGKQRIEVARIDSELASMRSSFQDGVDTIYNACVDAGGTPASKSPADIATCIEHLVGPEAIRKVLDSMQSYAVGGSSFSFTATENCFIYIPQTRWRAYKTEYYESDEHHEYFPNVNSVTFTIRYGISTDIKTYTTTQSAWHGQGGYTQSHNATGWHESSWFTFPSQTVYLTTGEIYQFSVSQSVSGLEMDGSVGSYIIVPEIITS